MKKEMKFKALHIPTGKEYWFDLMWGSMANNSGYIGMLPIEQLKITSRNWPSMHEDRIPVDPNECEITAFIDHEKANDEFEIAVRPLMEFLAKNYNPYYTAIVSSSRAELVSHEGIFETDDYILD